MTDPIIAALSKAPYKYQRSIEGRELVKEMIGAWIAALPPDAISQIVNAYRDAYEYARSDDPYFEGVPYFEVAAQAFRKALISLIKESK